MLYVWSTRCAVFLVGLDSLLPLLFLPGMTVLRRTQAIYERFVQFRNRISGARRASARSNTGCTLAAF